MPLIRNIIIGIILGVANIIPGVSAGTMAVVMKVYDKLINSITFNREVLRKNGGFLFTVIIGAVIGIISFSKIVKYLLLTFPMATNFFFIGIIIGSIPMIYSMAKKPAGNIMKTKNLVPFFIALSIMLLMVLTDTSAATTNIATTLSLSTFLQLFLTVAISAVAMIIPGISGSFIMLVLGVYGTVITAISDMNAVLLIPIGLGVIVGIVGGARAVRYLMNNHPQATYCTIMGLVLGSIFTVYPGFTFNTAGIISIIVMVLGILISYNFAKEDK